MNSKVEKALNKHLNAELYSAYMYYSMAAYFNSLNLNGMATWMKVQTAEEVTHSAMFNDYIIERGGRVKLTAIDAPPIDWDSPLTAFEAAYEHEQKVTGLINDLIDLALKENDHATNAFLQWFITEQVEEEANADGIVRNLKLVGGDGPGLFMIDQQLDQRTYTAPANAPKLP